jgi:hypothetical protein
MSSDSTNNKNNEEQENIRREQERKDKRMAGSEEFKKSISGQGLDDATLKGKYTLRELRSEAQSGNLSENDYQGMLNSGQKFNDKAQTFLDKKFGSMQNNSGGNGNNNGNNGGGGNGGNGGGGNGNNAMSHADRAIQGAKDVENIDFAKLQKSIHERPLYMQAQSDVYASNLWGDMWGSGYGGKWSRGNNNNDDD